MEILSNPSLSDAAVSSQTSHSSTQEPPTKKKLLMFLQKETGLIHITTTLCNHTPIQQLQTEVEAYKTSPKLKIDSDETHMRWWKDHSTVYPVLAKLSRKRDTWPKL